MNETNFDDANDQEIYAPEEIKESENDKQKFDSQDQSVVIKENQLTKYM